MKIGTKDELNTLKRLKRLKILKILKILKLFNLLGAAMFNRRWGKEVYPSSGNFSAFCMEKAMGMIHLDCQGVL